MPDLHHALLVESFAVAEEEEDLEQDEKWGRDQGLRMVKVKQEQVRRKSRSRSDLVPGLEQCRCSALENTVTDELRYKVMEAEEGEYVPGEPSRRRGRLERPAREAGRGQERRRGRGRRSTGGGAA